MESVLSRKERERLQRRHAMLEAARAVFAEKGFSNATIEEVAHRAEFGKGTLYNYFEGGKEDLLLAILNDLYDEMCMLIRSAFANQQTENLTFRQTFAHFAESFITYFHERQDLFMIITRETHQMMFDENHEKAAYLLGLSNRVVDALVTPLQGAIERGELKPLPAEVMAHAILGNIKGFLMHMCMADRHPEACRKETLTPRQSAEFISTMLLDGLLVQQVPVQNEFSR
jgi:TetR/AcrR family transcriptional regulator, repressor of fatR-cypB operon